MVERVGEEKQEMTILECLRCSHKFPSNEVELTNIDISDKYFRMELSKMQ